MHKFNYNGSEFEIGLTTIESDNFIIARLLTDAKQVFCDDRYDLYIGNTYRPVDWQVVIKTHYTAVKRTDYEKYSGKSYADLINYLEELCKPEPVTLEDVYKECKGKSPEAMKEILSKYEIRMWIDSSDKFSAWHIMSLHEFDLKEAHKLGLRQIRRKESC